MRLLSILAASSLLSLAALTSTAQSTSAKLPYQDPSLAPEQRAADLVHRMTLEEKVPQTLNTVPGIPRLGVPAYDYWNEGLHGVARSGYATMFPQAIGMAATWDAPLLGQIANVISTEARAKYNEAVRHDIHSIYYGLTIWSPNINIFRDPRWGRGQETYGEDPYLTSRLGVAFIKGLQGDNPKYYRVIATPKHFAVHSGPESTRHSANIDPTPHDLNDTYLPHFRAAIMEAKADSIMCAYNAVEGKPACASDLLLKDILRRDWGFKGFVTSDCGAIDDFFEKSAHKYSADKAQASADGIKVGTDTNCGTTYLALGDAVKRGLLKESEIDDSLIALFTARMKLGLFDPASMVPYASIPFSEVGSPAHAAMALDVARKSMVLLKNDGDFLPLKGAKTIAVVGPNAASLVALEGNYNAVPRHPSLPVDAIAEEFKAAKVLYAEGAPYAEGATLPVPRTALHPSVSSMAEGLKGEYFTGDSFDTKPVLVRTDKNIDFDWNSAIPVPGVSSEKFAVRWTGAISVPEAGSYDFSMRLAHCYPCGDYERFAVYFDGKQVQDFASKEGAMSRSSLTPRFTLSFADTKPHEIRVEYKHSAKLFGAGITLEWAPKAAPLLKGALDAAQKADVVLAFVGLSSELEGEEMPVQIEGFSGGDRTDIKLPDSQQKMLEALAATGKPLVVVLLNGSALAVNWSKENAKAVLEAWYPGESGGKAIAETLSGKNNPGGRLPVTFYTGIDQIPAFDDYSMAHRTYRYSDVTPLFRFGYGLSYTKFAYSNVKLSTEHLKAGDKLTVTADVKNVGSRAGDEVAELYLMPPHTDVSPKLALQGFQRLHLAPGATQHVTFTLDSRQLSQVDDKGVRAVTGGEYELSLGGSQPADGETKTAKFTIEGHEELPR